MNQVEIIFRVDGPESESEMDRCKRKKKIRVPKKKEREMPEHFSQVKGATAVLGI